MSDREYHGKEEEKQEEKGRGWDEKWRRDPLSAIVWATILIWAGVAMLLANAGSLDNWSFLGSRLQAWSVGFIGAGVIVLLEVVVRLLVPAYRRGVGGTLVFAAILLGVGFGEVVGWELTGALILIAIGLSALLSGLLRPR
ncbi:MAG: hypothetical protein PVH62_00355 [Anaerolineae bacterium]|jgi:hypothetical protein